LSTAFAENGMSEEAGQDYIRNLQSTNEHLANNERAAK
jgi:hypothetical protein